MANWYVRSGAVGTASGADWTNAKLTLAAAFTAGAAGDSFWVADDHAETQASALTLTAPGTLANPSFIYCVNRAGSVPPVSADLRTTATISTTGNSALQLQGFSAWNGIIFNCGLGAVAANLVICGTAGQYLRFNNCAFNQVQTGSGLTIIGTQTSLSTRCMMENCTFGFAAAGQTVLPRGLEWEWINTPSALTGTVLTNLTTSAGPAHANILFAGIDLSAMGAGKTLIVAAYSGDVRMLACKLGAGVTVAGTPTAVGTGHIDLVNCDSGGTNYRTERYAYEGTQTVETTIVRSGGASDGVTPIAWKFVTTANSRWVLPLYAIPIAIWNDTTGASRTVTVYGIWGGGAVPNNDEIWIDVEYAGDAGSPKGSFATSTKSDNLATGSALASDSSTWGGSTTKFKMSVTFTPQQKGPIVILVKVGRASSTFYVDPKPDVT